MTFAVGSLITARGREWVVLPESESDLLMVRPLGGTEDEVTGLYLPLETVKSAEFALPDLTHLGDHHSARMLRDAVRLGFRSSSGPFRSFARLAVEPRPYQLVPLLMALRLDPVRLLIADDVGIGKTIEAGLIARELLDRGEVQRLAVLCPPHLAEQWEAELKTKFHLDAELVLASTARRLERVCRLGESLFEHYPVVVVSMDFIKQERRRLEFVRTCPELVIVDEAHTCAVSAEAGTGRHQRHRLLSELSADATRHLILVTATPHSGKEDAFRSLLGLLDPAFAEMPGDLEGPERKAYRQRLAAHLVQRRRADIRHYIQADTKFPTRLEVDETYSLSPAYRRLIERAIAYARESVQSPDGQGNRQRVRWWSALALLGSLASSPAAAASTLRARSGVLGATTLEEADELGRQTVLDLLGDDTADPADTAPGADPTVVLPPEDVTEEDQLLHRRLLEMAREAEALFGDEDQKLLKAVAMVEQLLRDGFSPIVFCRFIPTAEYVAEQLRKRLAIGAEVIAVTGTLPPSEREARVAELGKPMHWRRVLVATDCLSEGINVQEHFDAVLHYDLSWNPTRHEQREGRVDRFGQPKPSVRVVTYYGRDNTIDGIVLDVLLRKHKAIRTSLGVSVPVPGTSAEVLEAVFEGLLLREQAGGRVNADQMALFEDLEVRAARDRLFTEWEDASAREKKSQTLFAQETIKPDEVALELEAVRAGIGTAPDVRQFVADAVRAHHGVVVEGSPMVLNLAEVPRALREAMDGHEMLRVRFELPIQDGEVCLTRTHPVVEGLATYVLDTALEAERENAAARRTAVVRTAAVSTRTTLLLLRARYHILTRRAGGEDQLLAEDLLLLAFEGAPASAVWLAEDRTAALLNAQPSGNMPLEQARHFLERVLEGIPDLMPGIEAEVVARGEAILEAHRRVRDAAKMKGVTYRVEPKLPADILGTFVYLPA